MSILVFHIDGDYIYWYDSTEQAIYKADKHNGTNPMIFATGVVGLNDFVIGHRPTTRMSLCSTIYIVTLLVEYCSFDTRLCSTHLFIVYFCSELYYMYKGVSCMYSPVYTWPKQKHIPVCLSLPLEEIKRQQPPL